MQFTQHQRLILCPMFFVTSGKPKRSYAKLLGPKVLCPPQKKVSCRRLGRTEEKDALFGLSATFPCRLGLQKPACGHQSCLRGLGLATPTPKFPRASCGNDSGADGALPARAGASPEPGAAAPTDLPRRFCSDRAAAAASLGAGCCYPPRSPPRVRFSGSCACAVPRRVFTPGGRGSTNKSPQALLLLTVR